MTLPTARLVDLKVQPIRPIRFWQNWRAVANTFRAYQPGTDALVDQIRSAGFLKRCVYQYLFAPLYFATEQGWTIREKHGELAAIMYLRRGARQGLRVMHIDDISVGANYRRLGLAHRLMTRAEELANQEKRPFLKLAVTVANTSAVTLYRRLGYQEQHHHFFTWLPSSAALVRLPMSTNLVLHSLPRRQASRMFQRFYRLEMMASVPTVASLLEAYYPQGTGITGVPLTGKRSYAILQESNAIGYGDLFRKGARWNLRLSLSPEWWGTETEVQAIFLLASTIGHKLAAEIALYVPSMAHFDAIRASSHAVTDKLGLMEQSLDRMIMVKSLTRTDGIKSGDA
jgi:ribosomal protein S18 acetylase RimI-like enzyme